MISWWTNDQAGLFGGLAGSAVGVLGGILGAISAHGKHKGLAYGMVAVMIGAGIISLFVGFFALLMQQPYGVYYPLILFGGVCIAVVGGVFFGFIRPRYREAENRRLDAEELRRGS